MARDHDPIENTEDIINTRDIERRIDWLTNPDDDNGTPEDEDEAEEYRALLALKEEAEGYCDWLGGATLIRDSYFEQYAEDFAEDISDYDSRSVRWPFTCIDWERAADELKQDFTEVDFDGVTYYLVP